MPKYYARLYREVRREVFLFWRAQILVGSSVSFVTAIIDVKLGVTAHEFGSLSVIAVGAGVIAGMVMGLVSAVVRAPVSLDNERLREIAEKQRHIDAAGEEISVLKTELMRKRPIDVAKEESAKRWMAGCSREEQSFFRWLLEQGDNLNYSRLYNSGIERRQIDSAVVKGREWNLIIENRDPRNGDLTGHINPSFREALTSILHSW